MELKSVGISSCLMLALLAGEARSESVRVDDDRWRIEAQGHEIVNFRGREALYLENGIAELEGVELLDGVLVFEVAFTRDRGFSGVRWRLDGEGDGEELYLRPHQSGLPDANQYTAVQNGLTAWQLYHGPRYATPVSYDFEGWNRVVIVFSGGEAEISINGADPPLRVRLQRPPAAGSIALISRFAPAWFAGIRYQPVDAPRMRGELAAARLQPEHPVLEWELSTPFAETALQGSSSLPDALLDGLQWQAVTAEPTGILNLSRWHRLGPGSNTALVRLRLHAAESGSQPVRFGFSDRVQVFLDGELLFTGNDGYRSRDYRFLGTVGLHDTLHLPLHEGKNELIFAISESFGGWGVLAELPPTPKVEILAPEPRSPAP